MLPGEVPFEDTFPYLEPKAVTSGIEVGCIVEIVTGAFKGEKARITSVSESKEEVSMELYEQIIPMTLNMRGDHVRVIEAPASESRLPLIEEQRAPHSSSLDWSFDFAAARILSFVFLLSLEALVASQVANVKRPEMNRMTPIPPRSSMDSLAAIWAKSQPPPAKANAMIRREFVVGGFGTLTSALTA